MDVNVLFITTLCINLSSSHPAGLIDLFDVAATIGDLAKSAENVANLEKTASHLISRLTGRLSESDSGEPDSVISNFRNVVRGVVSRIAKGLPSYGSGIPSNPISTLGHTATHLVSGFAERITGGRSGESSGIFATLEDASAFGNKGLPGSTSGRYSDGNANTGDVYTNKYPKHTPNVPDMDLGIPGIVGDKAESFVEGVAKTANSIYKDAIVFVRDAAGKWVRS